MLSTRSCARRNYSENWTWWMNRRRVGLGLGGMNCPGGWRVRSRSGLDIAFSNAIAACRHCPVNSPGEDILEVTEVTSVFQSFQPLESGDLDAFDLSATVRPLAINTLILQHKVNQDPEVPTTFS